MKKCAICGAELRNKAWIESKATGAYYCPRDHVQECEDRSLSK